MAEPEVALRYLVAELVAEMTRIDTTIAEIHGALRLQETRPWTPLERYGLARLVESFYTGVERVLDRIEAVFGGRDRSSAGWHRALLSAAALDVPGVRVAVLSPQSVEVLELLLAFRHRSRNLYAFELDEVRVRAVAEQAVAAWPPVRAEVEHFAAQLLPV